MDTVTGSPPPVQVAKLSQRLFCFVNWVCAPTPVAALQPARGCVFAREIFSCCFCQTWMGILGAESRFRMRTAAPSPASMVLSNGRVLPVFSWGRRGGPMIYKKPQSPQREREPSQHGVGLFPWIQSGMLWVWPRCRPAVLLAARLWVGRVIEKKPSFSWEATGAGLEAMCTREIHIEY